jgi:hypothetical protein
MDGLWFTRLVFSCLSLIFLTNCSHIHLVQDRNDMLVRVGSQDKTLPAAPYADIFLSYALLADQTYADSVYTTRRFDVGPQTYCYRGEDGRQPCDPRRDATPHARKLLNEWRLIYAEKETKAFPCIPERVFCTDPLPGLGVQIWVRKGRVCEEAVIAFRGTDGGSADDWLSNLRWITRLLPLYDQYEQVQDHAPEFIQAILDDPCFMPRRTRVLAVGHSLGGGLAQQAAYRDGRIGHVFAFDPSFVTGYYDIHVPDRERNARGLKIERVYEHGEILAYPRFVLRHLAPLSACNPQIRTIRFNTLTGSIFDQHKLQSLTTALLLWSREPLPPGVKKQTKLPGPLPQDCPGQDGPAEEAKPGVT